MKKVFGVIAAFFAFAFAASPANSQGLSMLHADGPNIVDSTGKTVVLRGVNLGGWLVEEMWMLPFETNPPAGSGLSKINDHVSLWNVVEQRFGEHGKERIRTAYRKSWITEADFQKMSGDGINCVRLPFLASLLDEPEGVAWLDRAVAWGGKYGIYVVLDLHGAPGGQNSEGHSGQEHLNQFFKDYKNVAAAVDLWKRIASRYKNSPVVAGYDLINEPTGTPNSDTLYVIQDRLYQAIRSVDSNHIVFIEDGYTGYQWMPYPKSCGWQNVAYSVHTYDFSAHNEDDQKSSISKLVDGLKTEREKRGVPYYVGEFGLEPGGKPETLKGVLELFKSSGISATMWTYKVGWAAGGRSLWGLYGFGSSIAPLDPFRDSEDILLSKCKGLSSTSQSEYSELGAAFRNAK
jgi:hypothetical protein